jgi:peptide deformylase
MSETEPTDAELLEILIAPHPTLRARARSVAPGELDAIRALLPAMYATMYKAPGIGLAAPQIGQSRRFAIVDVADGDERRPITLINPEIVARSESLAVHEEGCLSIPTSMPRSRVPSTSPYAISTSRVLRRPCRPTGCSACASSTRSTIWTGCCSSIISPRSSATC